LLDQRVIVNSKIERELLITIEDAGAYWFMEGQINCHFISLLTFGYKE
jgi:hypothetical protein